MVTLLSGFVSVMAQVHKFPELANLSKMEVWAILTLLTEYENKIELIQEEFKELFKKPIAKEIIQQLAAKYAGKIDVMAKKYEEEIVRNPLASRGMRLRLLWQVIKYSKEKRTRKTLKIGKEDYLELDGWDTQQIINAVMGAERICDNHEKRRIDWAKLGKTMTADDDTDIDFEVNDGGVSGFSDEEAI